MKKQLLFVAAVLVSAATTFAQNVPSYVPTNGLVGWWPFNGNANDESGNGNNGTVNGATLTTDRNGKVNSAYSFDGLSNKINLPNLGNLNEFSFSIWVKSNGENGVNLRSFLGSTGVWSVGHMHTGVSTNEIWVALADNTSTNNAIQSQNYNLNNQDWINITYNYKSSNKASLYINGVFVTDIQTTNTTTLFNSLAIGFSHNNNRYWFGKIDDLCFYNRILSQQEITNLYQGCKDENATTSSLSNILLTNSTSVTLNANPSGGTFSGAAVANGQFVPSKAHLGKNAIKYNFTNSTGCKDSTDFYAIVADTNTCSTYDTLKIKINITAGVYANQTNEVKIYPNPTNTDLVIDNGNFAMLTGYKVAIFNSVGAKVYEGAINSSETTIPLSSLGNKGIYIVSILDSNNQTVENKTIVLE